VTDHELEILARIETILLRLDSKLGHLAGRGKRTAEGVVGPREDVEASRAPGCR